MAGAAPSGLPSCVAAPGAQSPRPQRSGRARLPSGCQLCCALGSPAGRCRQASARGRSGWRRPGGGSCRRVQHAVGSWPLPLAAPAAKTGRDGRWAACLSREHSGRGSSLWIATMCRTGCWQVGARCCAHVRPHVCGLLATRMQRQSRLNPRPTQHLGHPWPAKQQIHVAHLLAALKQDRHAAAAAGLPRCVLRRAGQRLQQRGIQQVARDAGGAGEAGPAVRPRRLVCAGAKVGSSRGSSSSPKRAALQALLGSTVAWHCFRQAQAEQGEQQRCCPVHGWSAA